MSSLAEDLLEKIHMRVHPEEGLANGNEAGDVQHPIRIEVLLLQPLVIVKPA